MMATKIIRGGSYWDIALICRPAFRLPGLPGNRNVTQGFRPVAEVIAEMDILRSVRVLRGGCFGLPARRCRAASRYGGLPGESLDYLGFRPVAEAKC
jgi:formylglycine-generating enzyme required for sulfatase activity